jgi:hypothetical protein
MFAGETQPLCDQCMLGLSNTPMGSLRRGVRRLQAVCLRTSSSNRPLDLFCETCERLCCKADCGCCNTHSGHSVVDLGKYVQKVKRRLCEEQESLKAKFGQSALSAANLDSDYSKKKAKIDQEKKRITKQVLYHSKT